VSGPDRSSPGRLPGEEPSLAAVAADVVVVVGSDGVVRSVDGWRPGVAGRLAALRPGTVVRDALGPDEATVAIAAALARVLEEPGADSTQVIAGLGGPGTWTEIAVRPFGDGAVLLGSDVTATRVELERLNRLADLLTGPVTGLGGRIAFTGKVAELLELAGAGPVGVVVAHLDRFRPVGLAHGWRGRAEVLAVLADRLASVVPSGSLLNQPSDDTFAMSVRADPMTLAALAEEVRSTISRPLSLSAAAVVITASVGFSSGHHGDDAERLVHDAELAAVAAALDGGDRVLGASEDRRQLTLWRHQLEQALRRALTEDGFRVLYQPEIELATGRVIGAEALLRWEHEPWRDRSPGEVVALAEQVGLIGVLGEWVLRKACGHAASWSLPPGEAPYVAVNVSALQVADPRFGDVVASALATSGLEPGRLCLELTETASVSDIDLLRERLLSLKTLGVSIALDDFGTGYAGLDQVSRLPVDIVKLDARFVAGMQSDEARLAVVEAAVELASRLGVRLIAEGVEELLQEAMLTRLGYHAAQGFVVGLPGDSADLERELWRRATGGAAQSNDVTQT
jgi:EAL domain-containing protein (putative c-di-GMP-specific phosphodiesterase class I)/GGDEF domain-containing protein